MSTLALIQARMGSTRLPGKVLMEIGGETMLARVVRRAARAACLDGVALATTTNPEDDVLQAEAARLHIRCYRGSSEDVLERYFRAAQAFGADAVVRITSDCPMIDPGVIDMVGSAFDPAGCDYASNTFERTFPRGLDTEMFTMEALARARREAHAAFEREHVTPYFYQHPDLFRLTAVRAERDYSANRWTVDTPEDLEFARALYARLGNTDTFSWRNALDLIAREPQLAELNRHIVQKALHSS